MKRGHKRLILAAATLSAALVQPSAGVVLFLDLGDQGTGVLGGPTDNSNPDIQAYPTATVVMHLWAVPEADDDKVIAALGFDLGIAGTAASSVSLEAYALDNPTIGPNQRWNDAAVVGGLNQGPKLVDDQRAVFVPTAEPFVGGIGSANLAIDPGYDPASGAVYLGQCNLKIAVDAAVGSSAELRFAVGHLLIAQVTTGTWTAEPIYFGYTGTGAEPADGTGSDVGATSAIADATITIVHAPADFDQDGDVDVADFTTFSDCMTGPDVTPTPPCQQCDLDSDNDVDTDDFGIFQSMFTSA